MISIEPDMAQGLFACAIGVCDRRVREDSLVWCRLLRGGWESGAVMHVDPMVEMAEQDPAT
jgi:hypothetical protein